MNIEQVCGSLHDWQKHFTAACEERDRLRKELASAREKQQATEERVSALQDDRAKDLWTTLDLRKQLIDANRVIRGSSHAATSTGITIHDAIERLERAIRGMGCAIQVHGTATLWMDGGEWRDATAQEIEDAIEDEKNPVPTPDAPTNTPLREYLEDQQRSCIHSLGERAMAELCRRELARGKP